MARARVLQTAFTLMLKIFAIVSGLIDAEVQENGYFVGTEHFAQYHSKHRFDLARS